MPTTPMVTGEGTTVGEGSGVSVGVGGTGVAVGAAVTVAGGLVGWATDVEKGVLVGAGGAVGDEVGVLRIAGRGAMEQALKSIRARSAVSSCNRGFKMRVVLQKGSRVLSEMTADGRAVEIT